MIHETFRRRSSLIHNPLAHGLGQISITLSTLATKQFVMEMAITREQASMEVFIANENRRFRRRRRGSDLRDETRAINSPCTRLRRPNGSAQYL